MKKILLSLTCFLIAIACVACSSGTAEATKSGSYWLYDYTDMTVGNVDETCVYDVNMVAYANAKVKPSDQTKGTYTTTLTNVVENEVAYYKLQSELEFSGEYVQNGTATTFEDYVRTTVWFSGVNSNLKPLKTTKEVQSTSPVTDINGNVELKVVKYNYTVEYTGKKANVTLTETSDEKMLGKEGEFSHKYSSTDFCENELLFFYPRMFNLSKDGFKSSLKTFNALSNSVQTLSFTVESTNKKYSSKEFSYATPQSLSGTKYGSEENPISVDCLSVCLSGTYSGPKQYAYYTTVKTGFKRVVLVKLQAPVYGVGQLVYTLNSYSTTY